MKILVVEDDHDLRQTVLRALRREQFQAFEADTVQTALEMIPLGVDLIVSDVNLPDGTGLQVLQSLREKDLKTPMVLMTAYGSIKAAIEAVRLGAFQYLTKPIHIEELLQVCRTALKSHQAPTPVVAAIPVVAAETPPASLELAKCFVQPRLPGISEFEIEKSLVGDSAVIRKLYQAIQKVAAADSTVLITGESGTGKELVARSIHGTSTRSEMPFVAINCGAIPRDLLESELFGHVKGAFTGAHAAKEGKVLAAKGGTLFLDEIGDMPLELQVKLLRFLQTKTIEPVGSSKTIRVDVRILAATNVNLEEMVNRKKFREDLFYRLNVIPLSIAPLRERPDDIPILLQHFLRKFSREKRREIQQFHPSAMSLLCQYQWPGNVRELENVVERMVVMASGTTIEEQDLPSVIQQSACPKPVSAQVATFMGIPLDAPPSLGVNLPEYMSTLEDEMIKRALQASGGNKQKASQMLGLNRTTLIEKMKKRGIPLSFPQEATH